MFVGGIVSSQKFSKHGHVGVPGVVVAKDEPVRNGSAIAPAAELAFDPGITEEAEHPQLVALPGA